MENNNTKDIKHNNEYWSKNFSFQDEVDTSDKGFKRNG